jgi:hypothetical protein
MIIMSIHDMILVFVFIMSCIDILLTNLNALLKSFLFKKNELIIYVYCFFNLCLLTKPSFFTKKL